MTRAALFDTPGLTTAVEIASHRVSAVRLADQNGRATVLAHAVQPLPPGAVVPSLTAANIVQPDPVVAAVSSVLAGLGARASRVGLLVPDPVAKVSLIRFEKVPQRAEDLEQLVRWQVRKTAPFQIDEAQVTFSRAAAAADGSTEFVVALARRAVIEEYESICTAAGVRAGLVDLATFNIVNAVLAGDVTLEDWLLVAIAPTYTTIAIVRGGDLIFFRNRPEGEGSLADLVHQTAMYYEDRLGGGGFARILLSGSGSGDGKSEAQLVQAELEARLGSKVEHVDPRNVATLTDRIVAAPALLDCLAPLVGLLVRAKAA